ncbi:hypothetical protein [Sphaerisporangium sp. TRM90804]|uniref:hypothetical protein n=1 Tax=Sphaerisporangium sp. TRM90804 TaxID=3031113 RepID=UPI00244CA619|nr:hypothetical protein [Sphaerisporangium sp. TRM90804]MDH2429016.1 hypothetical protein [Sphaerisporangium sp. TRM90804]
MTMTELAAAATAYVAEAVNAYGLAVFTRAQDDAAGATVNLGHRILRRLFRRGDAPELEEAVRELDGNHDDEDLRAVVRVQLRKLLASDAELAQDLRRMLGEAGVRVTVGDRGVVTGVNEGIIQTGDGSAAFQDRRNG